MRVYKTAGAEKKTEQITVLFPRYVMEELVKKAEKESISKTEMARRLIVSGLELKHG